MDFFRRSSIKTKLVFISMLVSSLSILLSSGAFMTYEWFTFHHRLVYHLSTQAYILASNCVGAISFNDPQDAEEVLNSLSSNPSIAFACIYRNNGTVFASYERGDLSAFRPPVPQKESHRFDKQWLYMFKPIIREDGRPIGTIYLQSDLNEIRFFLRQGFIVSGFVILLATFFALFLSSKLQKMVSIPIFQLAEIAKDVSLNQNYAIRASKQADDELGLLTDAFNKMLDQVQKRDTALRESEEKFRTLFEQSLDAIVITYHDGKFIDFNRSFLKLLGYEKEELLRMNARALWENPDDRSLWQQEMADKGFVVDYEWKLRRKDGILKDCILNAVSNQSKDGNIIYYTTCRDITDKKLMDEELAKYRQHLEELVRERTRELEEAHEQLIRKERLAALGQLTATVAHEIRNPLGTVKTSIFSIGDALERNEPDRIDRALTLAERNIQRCDGIITELLDYTRKWVMKPDSVTIDRWLNDLLDEQEIPEGIECRRELHADLVLPISREHLRRAVVNVITNALQAMQEEETTGNSLTIESAVADGRLEIRIIDTGPGIVKEYLDKVFEPLFSTKGFGIGLGLPIVRDIMEKHGGGIEIRSELGKGTTVILWLPMKAGTS